MNAINPAAPPPDPASYTLSWNCSATGSICPAPLNDQPSPDISFASNAFRLPEQYTLNFGIDSRPTVDPNYVPAHFGVESVFLTTCFV